MILFNSIKIRFVSEVSPGGGRVPTCTVDKLSRFDDPQQRSLRNGDSIYQGGETLTLCADGIAVEAKTFPGLSGTLKDFRSQNT